MKIGIRDIQGKKVREADLPQQFNEEMRPDLVRRAFLAIRSHDRQPYGSDPDAGMRTSAKLSRRRRKYKGSYGLGISRVPRKIMSRRGTRFNWVGAFAPGMVGGRRAHPPKSEKKWDHKLNKKERKKAIRSALASAMNSAAVASRGHRVPAEYPFAFEAKAEQLSKTKEVISMLEAAGLEAEMLRIRTAKVRAGKGKRRGRKYKVKKGPLVVVSGDCPLLKAVANIRGVEGVRASSLNCRLLAPGGDPGRLTIFTEDALEKMQKEKLYMEK